MTAQDKDRIECAIRHIQTAADVDPWAVEIAVEAMQKQIPKKPDMVADVYMKNLYNLYCPVCKTKLGNGNSRIGYTDIYNKKGDICDCCGQAIDWEER